MAKKRTKSKAVSSDEEDSGTGTPNKDTYQSPRKKSRNDDNDDNVSPNIPSTPQSVRSNATPSHGTPIRSINPAGKPAEAGIIHKVYVENFMCHRKLTISLSRNVNFVHGQNGSGKSAILAAIQICLGAGAKRTHRARNLRDLVRKEGNANVAKVRVTLLNRGPDAYKPDVYGETITVERSISLNSGSYNGYKLLDHQMVARSKAKKDLDQLLDQLNIQVENPVAVLDQEEAKKFLCGKPEDKYAFFAKATELERLDRQYASIFDTIGEMSESRAKVENSLMPKKETVEILKKEWEQFEVLEKMEDKVSTFRVKYGWSLYWECKEQEDEETNTFAQYDEMLNNAREKLSKAENSASTDSNEEAQLHEKLSEFTTEADEATRSLHSQEAKLKAARQPLKQNSRILQTIVKEKNVAKRRLQAAQRELKKVRDEIMRKEGSAESEEAKRTTRRMKAEENMNELKKGIDEREHQIRDSLLNYDRLKPEEEALNNRHHDAQRQLHAVRNKVNGLKASEGNSMALFGNKCASMYQKVELAKRQRKFCGEVIGPIGHHLKIVAGKENLAGLAQFALGMSLDKFIVTNDQDRSYFMRLRNEAGCNPRECLVMQTNIGPRYQTRSPPDGVDTIESVINIPSDLVYNCLVDFGKIETRALMNSIEESQEALLIQENGGRCSIRGGNIKEVYFLPQGDNWTVNNGAFAQYANKRPLKQSIGIDRTQAIREGENEAQLLSEEVEGLQVLARQMKDKRHRYKVEWNNLKGEDRSARREIERLDDVLEKIREESTEAENITIDTTEYEDDVNEAERACDDLKGKEEETKKVLEELNAPILDLEAKVDETRARSEKVTNDLNEASEKLSEYMRGQQQRDRALEKKRKNLKKIEEARDAQIKKVEQRTEMSEEAMQKARLVTYQIQQTLKKKEENASGFPSNDDEDKSAEELNEELELIEPIDINKNPDYYKNKIQRGEKEIERERKRRQITEVDPEVALDKYQRAKKDLETKMKQLVSVEENVTRLVEDLRERKERWKTFRSHISEMSNQSFDGILNKKGSSGFIEFDHKYKQLNLVVQKDNRDEMTQTNDVKALSGGERSFTTLSLLLALGESLETPFRVMDEFDVFLDPVARKIALETMVRSES